MSVIFLEGIVILLLVLCGLREAIMDAIPVVLRHAISVGLGLFIAMIGLCDAGIITAGAGTLVGLGDIASPTFIVGIISIVVTVALASRNVPGSRSSVSSSPLSPVSRWASPMRPRALSHRSTSRPWRPVCRTADGQHGHREGSDRPDAARRLPSRCL